MAKRRPFYLYQRKKKGGDYWYVCYINPETGKQDNAKSIDVLKERLGIIGNSAITHRDDAAIIANKALEAGIIYSDFSGMEFTEYCLSVWDYEGTYVTLRNKIKEGSIGREYCMNMLCNFRKHVLPYIPSGLKLISLTTRHLDLVVEKAFADGLANGTIQLIILSFSVPLKEAVRQGIIRSNPADCLYRIPRVEKRRGILTESEVLALRSVLDTPELNESFRLAIILALTTGMRSGEIRALRKENIVSRYTVRSDGTVLDKIIISSSLAPYSGVKSTKGRYERSVLIPHELGVRLCDNAVNGIAVPGSKGGYMSSPSLRFAFYELLYKIGIDEEERKERNLTFHSLRHYFSTYTRDHSVSQEDRMLVLGHRSVQVNERYTHATDIQLENVSYSSCDLYTCITSHEGGVQ